MSDSPHIVYIAGAAHSGSTLLDLLIGSHSEAWSLGELKVLSRGKHAKRQRVLADRCTCRAPFKLACDFWRGVDQRLQTWIGCGLAEIDVDHSDPGLFVRHNAALFRAAAETSGASWLVDSSKSPRRLARLLDCGRFDVRVISLTRNPQAVAYSHVRKGRGVARAAWRAAVSEWKLAGTLSGRRATPVRYEDLVARPRDTLARVMEDVGLVYEDAQLDWARHRHHTLCGNHMRFAATSEIRADDAWRSELSPAVRGGTRALVATLRAGAALRRAVQRDQPRSTSR